MVYGITAGEVLVAHSGQWEEVARSMHWWVGEVLTSWSPLDTDDERWNASARQAHEGWTGMLSAFNVYSQFITRGVTYPLWEGMTPGASTERLAVRVGLLTKKEVERLPQPGSLARARFDDGDKKVKVISHHVGTMTSTVRITSRTGMPSGSARRIITLPWAFLLARP